MNGSTDPFIGSSDPLADLLADFPQLLPPATPADELSRLFNDTQDPLNFQPPTGLYNAPQMTTPFYQTPSQSSQAGFLDGCSGLENLMLQGSSQPTQTMSANGFTGLEALVYQGNPQSGQIQPEHLSQTTFPRASSPAGSSPLSDAPPEDSTSSALSRAPPALSTRAAKASAASGKPRRATTSSRKPSKVSGRDDEPIEVIPRRFFPPVGARKQHRSGFRQLPGADGIVKRGRPSKKEYKQAGVRVDMYAHNKILLPSNKDQVDMEDIPRPKKKTKSRNDRSSRASNGMLHPVESQHAPQGLLPSLPQVDNFGFSQPLVHESQVDRVDLSSLNTANFDFTSFVASLGAPAPPMVQTQSDMSSFSMHPTHTNAGYVQDSSYLSVPYNTPYASTSSSTGVIGTLGDAIQPDLLSFSFQDGVAVSSDQSSSVGNYSSYGTPASLSSAPGMSGLGPTEYGSFPLSAQASSVGNYSSFGTPASLSSAPGMSGLGPTEYGSFPLSAQSSSMGTSNSYVGSSGQPNEYINSFQHALPDQTSYMSHSVSNIGSSSQSTGFDPNSFQPNNQYMAPVADVGVDTQSTGLDLDAFLNQQVQYGAPAPNAEVDPLAAGFDLDAFLAQQDQYGPPNTFI